MGFIFNIVFFVVVLGSITFFLFVAIDAINPLSFCHDKNFTKLVDYSKELGKIKCETSFDDVIYKEKTFDIEANLIGIIKEVEN